MLRSYRHAALAAAAVTSLASLSYAQITGILSNRAGAANNVVPTVGGPFNPGTAAFDRPFFSQDGNRWILGALKDDVGGTDDKDIVIVGTGPNAVGAQTVAVEDSPLPFDPNSTYATIRQPMGINNAGQWVFEADTTIDTTKDDIIVRFDGVNIEAAIQESNSSPVVGQNFGSTNSSAHILADGTVRYRSVLSPTTTKQILGSGTTVLAETDVSVPTGQLVAPAQSLDAITNNRFVSSSDGSQYIWSGDLNGPTGSDGFIAINNAIVAQEGAQLPGGVMPGVNVGVVSTSTTDRVETMSHNGSHWLARVPMADGTGATATDVYLYNGGLQAKTGDPIFPGSTELWEDAAFTTTYFLGAVNDNGDRVIGGLTNVGNVNADAVLVYYGASGNAFVLAREGDPVDLDGNGLFDDGAFIDTFGNDDGVLTNDNRFYIVATVQDAAGAALAQGFLQIAVPEPATAGLLAVASVLLGRRRRTA